MNNPHRHNNILISHSRVLEGSMEHDYDYTRKNTMNQLATNSALSCRMRKGTESPTAKRARVLTTWLSITIVAILFSGSIYLISIVHLWNAWQKSEVSSLSSLPSSISPVVGSSSTATFATTDSKASLGKVNTIPERPIKSRRVRYKTLPKSDIDQIPILPSNVSAAVTSLPNPSETELKFLETQLRNNSIIYKPGSWDGAGIVIPEYKLVFFTQGKVACTVFKQLFRRMMHLDDWAVHLEPYIPHDPWLNGLTYLYHYHPNDALTILTSPHWTRAIFVRDPKERLLSAYLDKAAKKDGMYVRRHCCNNERKADPNNCGRRASASFLGFLNIVKDRCPGDPHWRLQSTRITWHFRKYVNFVGHFERIHDDTKRLLDHLTVSLRRRKHNDTTIEDLWERYGASGWGPNGTASIFAVGTNAKHQTSSQDKMRKYYNVTVEAFVDQLYERDYSDTLLNFTPMSLFPH